MEIYFIPDGIALRCCDKKMDKLLLMVSADHEAREDQ